MNRLDCLALAQLKASQNGWSGLQMARYYQSLCITCGVDICEKTGKKQAKRVTAEEIAKLKAQMERTDAAVERARIAEEKARIRVEKAAARLEKLRNKSTQT